jgi:hypothetical protein
VGEVAHFQTLHQDYRTAYPWLFSLLNSEMLTSSWANWDANQFVGELAHTYIHNPLAHASSAGTSMLPQSRRCIGCVLLCKGNIPENVRVLRGIKRASLEPPPWDHSRGRGPPQAPREAHFFGSLMNRTKGSTFWDSAGPCTRALSTVSLAHSVPWKWDCRSLLQKRPNRSKRALHLVPRWGLGLCGLGRAWSFHRG